MQKKFIKNIVFCISAVCVFTVFFTSCKKKNDENDKIIATITTESQTVTEQPVQENTSAAFSETAEVSEVYSENTTQPQTTAQAVKVSQPQTTAAPKKQESTTKKNKQTSAETTTEKYKKTGKSIFSDDKNNKYLNAVAKKYKVLPETLACVYTVPDTNGNIVLQFDGSVDKNNRYIRNNDTLIAIYTVDKNLNSKRASNDEDLNEYEYGEMKTMFFSVGNWIIPKFETELNDAPVKK